MPRIGKKGAESDAGSAGADTKGMLPVRPADAGTTAAFDLGGDDGIPTSALEMIERRKKTKRRKRIITAGIVVGVLVVVIAGIVTLARMGAAAAGAAAYEDAQVTRTDFESTVSASGAIQPISSVQVTPEVDGIISNVSVSVGDEVEEGDTLFTLKNDDLDKGVDDAEQQVKTAKNGVRSAQIALDKANDAYADATKTTTIDVPASVDMDGDGLDDETHEPAHDAYTKTTEPDQSAVDAAAQGVSEAKIGVDNANITLSTAQTALSQAQKKADKRTVTAQKGGTVIDVKAQEGAAFGAAQGGSAASAQGSLVTIADLSQMRVTVQVNEVDVNKLSVGQTGKVTFSALPDVTLDATIDRIATTATSASPSSSSGEGASGGTGVVTYAVELVISDPDANVKPGMTANVKIVTERYESVLTVPAAALVEKDDGTTAVTVPSVDGGDEGPVQATEERIVTVKAKDASTAVVEGDLKDGDTILIPVSTGADAAAGAAATA